MVYKKIEGRFCPSLGQINQKKISSCGCADKISNSYQEKAGEVRSLSQGSLKVEKADGGGKSKEMAM